MGNIVAGSSKVIPGGPGGGIQTLFFPSNLHDPAGNFPYMCYSIGKYPQNASGLIKDVDNASSFVNNTSGEISQIAGTYGPSNINISSGTNSADPNSTSKPFTISSMIALPISNSITNAIGIDWSMSNNLYTEAALGALKNNMSTNGMSSADTVVQYIENISGGLNSFLNNTAPAYFQDFVAKVGNRQINEKKQSIFNSVTPRQFTFEHIFTATNQAEANTIEQIIKILTMSSLPTLAKGGLLLDFPSEFQISFHGVKGFPKLDPMVCVAIQTNYTPNTLQILNDGHAVQIAVALSFMETTLLTSGGPGI